MGGIIWLASYPKSGNTWTRSFLHALLSAKAAEKDSSLVLHDGSYDINRMNLLTTVEIAGGWYKPHIDKPLEEATYEELAAVRMKAQEAIAATTKDLVFVKTHNVMARERDALTINPKVTAGAIYIVRNPLDVAISFRHHMNMDQDRAIAAMARAGTETAISDIAAYEVYGSWSYNVESWTRKAQRTLFVMRYEDMLENPLETFGKLAKWLKQPVTPDQLETAIEASSFDKLKAQEEEQGFKEKPKNATRFFREGRAGQWRDVLTEKQIKQIIADHRPQMERFGYVPEGY